MPKSGNAWDSFPSGHAVHMGAIVGPAARLSPPLIRPLVVPLFAALASTRVIMLAHYPTDVLAGWGIGWLIDRAVAGLHGRVCRHR